ncbi:hypothetical protein [Neptunicella sp. SCSIO 80796]|uniref:hypothetical protein n=1 Tax=Neptunicella plasticusilytica TaxID=3117012 RepID=UPI003A4DD458
MMDKLATIQDCLNKTCVIGLTYFDLQGEAIKQLLLGGKVAAVDAEKGITVQLVSEAQDKNCDFILPVELACWFRAPRGDYHTSSNRYKIVNPDYLVTWDIYQTQQNKANGEHQWWEWVPRCQEPLVQGA